ncbi:uncharacterized protein LOC125242336 [Leguminivora glycinivorella]|uniref:uncharacterized protein LOC125242336 n=1 Tax=Leguminivora glycinivorella TaxID=1035111 RepID=UPI00200C9E33|nr:uncharacterized protein LOC125242336 [Leguminivora glycinivorella]
MISTGRGLPLLMLNGYTFSKNSRGHQLYYCSKLIKGCKARVKLDLQGWVERLRGEHNHPPPQYVQTADGLYMKINKTYSFIPTARGKPLLMVAGYTFSFKRETPDHTFYVCSRYKSTSCPCSCKIDAAGNLVQLREHTHYPPKYVATQYGSYKQIA